MYSAKTAITCGQYPLQKSKSIRIWHRIRTGNNPSISKNVIINAIPDDILFHDEIVNVVNKIYDLGLQKEFIEFIKDPVNNKDALISKIPPDTPGYNEIILMVNFIADNSDLIKDYITNPDNIDFINTI